MRGERPTLLIRTDASVPVGTGHAMRCLALAQAWQDEGGDVVFAMAETTESIRDRLRRERFEIVHVDGFVGSVDDSNRTAEIARSVGARFAVLDGYRFRRAHQDLLRSAGARVLVIDDNGEVGDYTADLVLNQNIHAAAEPYAHRAEHTELLLGVRYALLRREFRDAAAVPRPTPSVAVHLLVTLGGSDPTNASSRIIAALRSVNLPDLEVVLVVGGSNPHLASIEQTASEWDGRLRVVRDASDMAALMRWADVAISAAGSTCWELASMGVPIAAVVVAENQRRLAARLDEIGAISFLGETDSLSLPTVASRIDALCRDAERRSRMTGIGRQLVDGRGAQRVAARLLGRPEPDAEWTIKR